MKQTVIAAVFAVLILSSCSGYINKPEKEEVNNGRSFSEMTFSTQMRFNESTLTVHIEAIDLETKNIKPIIPETKVESIADISVCCREYNVHSGFGWKPVNRKNNGLIFGEIGI